MTAPQSTTAAGVLAGLRERGVTLWLQDGRLRFRGPQGAMTDERRAEVRRHGAEIVELLRDGERAPAPALTARPEERHEPFELTDIQAAYLVGRHDVGGYGGVACHLYVELPYPAELDPDRFVAAWRALVGRHDMLRAVVEPDGSQRVLADVPPLAVPVADLTGGGDAAVTAHLEAQRTELGHEVRDPARWPLFSVRLTRTSRACVLHLSLDSLVMDAGSVEVLLGDLDALLADPTRDLPELEVTFRDYVLAEHALRDGDRYRSDREYWLDRIDAMPPAPDLPTVDLPAGPGRFVRHDLRMPPERWTAFRERAREHGLTASAAVLAGYAAVLERWSRSTEFTLNVTVANRLPLHPQVDRLVGDFTSVSLLAVRPDRDAAFAGAAAALADELFDAVDHRLYSGVEVLREMARRRGRDAALMPVVFTSVLGVGARETASRGRRYGWGITQTPQVALDCQVTEDPDGLRLSWDVREGAFRDGVVEDMFAALVALLDALVDEPATWRSTDPVPLPRAQVDERARLRTTDDRIPTGLLHDEVFAQARRTPDRVAVTAVDGTATYAELVRRADTAAANLRERGQRAGDLVAVAIDKSVDQIAAVLGILRAGGAYLPLDPGQPQARRDRMLADAGVRHVLVRADDGNWPDGLVPVAVGGPGRPAPDDGSRRPEDLAYVIFTSGSTGRPKGVMITHRAARNTVQDIDRRYGVSGRDTVLGLAQLSFDLSVYDVFGPLAHGGALVLPDPSRGPDPSHWAQLLSAHAVTLWNTVPAQLQMLVTYLETDPVPLPALRLALLSGDWIPVSLPDRARARVPQLELISLGGATEAAIWSIEHPITEVDPGWSSVPYGAPLTNQDVRVLDGRMRDAPTWVTGELYIAGAGVAEGYLGDDGLTAERFLRHPDGTRVYRTGDLGRVLPGGEIEFLGRADTQVKIRGHRIELGEIEAALLAHPAVDAAAVVVDGDPRGERSLLGFAEPARVDPSAVAAGPDPARLVASARAAGEREAAGVDVERWAADEELVAAGVDAAVVRVWRRAGLFACPDGGHRPDEVLERTPAADRRVRAWIEALLARGVLVDAGGLLRCTLPAADPGAAWDRLAEPGSTVPPARLDLLRGATDRLPALPEGGAGDQAAGGGGVVAGVLGEHDPVARYLVRAGAAALHRIAASRPAGARRLRVLEIGAGSGAYTAAALAVLDGFAADYRFTDPDPARVAAGRTRFGDRDRVRFGTLDVDVDADPRAQGLEPNAFDVVIGDGALHSAADVPAALRWIADLLAPGGHLLLTLPTAPRPDLLLTRAAAGAALPGERWRALLETVGGRELVRLPEDAHPFAAAGVRLVVARVKADRAALRPDDLAEHLLARLPEYMVPAHLQVVDALPHTGNGKIDRRMLLAWRPVTVADDDATGDAPVDDLEERLALLWRAALGVPAVGRTQSFYELGADSLVMARVAGQLREEVAEAAAIPFDVLLRQLLNEPTIALLAVTLRAARVEEPGAAGGGAERLPAGVAAEPAAVSTAKVVPFGDQEVAGPLRVLLPGAPGTVTDLRHLARHLVAQGLGPVAGIAIADTGRYLALAATEAVGRLAADAADRLAGTGHTRFQVIAHGLGGPAGVDLARELLARGLDVVDVTLVESTPMAVDTDEELLLEAEFVTGLGLDPVAVVLSDLPPEELARAVRTAAAEHGGRVPAGALARVGGDPGLERVAEAVGGLRARGQDARMAGYAAALGERAGRAVEPRLLPALFRVTRHGLLGSLVAPRPYPGDVTFLRASSGPRPGALAGDGTDPGVRHWSGVCRGRLTVVDVPGRAVDCVGPDHVGAVAEQVARPLRTNAAAQ